MASAAQVCSTAAIRSSACSSRCMGGRKTCRQPARASMLRAVWGTSTAVTQAHGRVAGGKVKTLAARFPRRGIPAADRPVPAQWNHETGRRVEPARKRIGEVAPFQAVLQVRLGRVEIDRYFGLACQRRQRILIDRLHVTSGQTQMANQRLGEALRMVHAVAVVAQRFGQPLGIAPDRHAVLAPEDAQRPARQRLARIPLALRCM